MLVVALTGSLGAGKSTVGRALAARGAVVVDADVIARQVTARGTAGEANVIRHFGSAVSAPDGGLDRRALARIVFSDDRERQALEEMTHPLIREEMARLVADARASGAQVAVLELPLLDSDRRRQYGVDLVVLVETPVSEAVRRVVQRGLPEDDARARLAAQPTEAERRSLADRVFLNTSGLEELDARVDELWAYLLAVAEGRQAR
ncbi:MAG TPA: dephospho-CoA kinase [Acidimicrobiales bacterium]|nr:dephospho-CoA kinase [Acidimicrobiales bacterium]